MLFVIVGLFAITVLCVTVGDRFGLPYPILMLLSAAALTFIPGFPVPQIPPDLILQLFLPPLLFATARNTSWSVFRKRWHLLLSLAVILTALSAFLAALTVWWLVPGITFPVALLMGAVVAPPDPVAVDSVSGSARMPRRLMMLLQSEGLFNDAVAIVLFQTSISAVVAREESISPTVILSFLGAAAGAVVVGIIIGFLHRLVGKVTHNIPAQVAVSIVSPFAAYLIAEHFGASGVIAVVVTALETNRRDTVRDGATRIALAEFWDVLNLLVTGLAFGLIGLQMKDVFSGEVDLMKYVLPAGAVVVVLFALRFVFVLVLGRLSTTIRLGELMRESLLLTWSGMRGLATLALALAVPYIDEAGNAFDERRLVLIVAATVIFVSLVPTGLSLPWLSRKLVPASAVDHSKEIAKIVRKAQHASLAAVEEAFPGEEFTDELRRTLQHRFQTLRDELAVGELLDADEKAPRAFADATPHDEHRAHQQYVDRMVRVALDAARGEVLRARGNIDVDPELADRVLRILDERMMIFRRR